MVSPSIQNLEQNNVQSFVIRKILVVLLIVKYGRYRIVIDMKNRKNSIKLCSIIGEEWFNLFLIGLRQFHPNWSLLFSWHSCQVSSHEQQSFWDTYSYFFLFSDLKLTEKSKHFRWGQLCWQKMSQSSICEELKGLHGCWCWGWRGQQFWLCFLWLKMKLSRTCWQFSELFLNCY